MVLQMYARKPRDQSVGGNRQRGSSCSLSAFMDYGADLPEDMLVPLSVTKSSSCCMVLQTYARKLGSCLLEATDDECPAAERMHRWTMELTSLMMCVALGSKMGYKYFQGYNMETGKVDILELGDTFYSKLLVSSRPRFLSMLFCLPGKAHWAGPSSLQQCNIATG